MEKFEANLTAANRAVVAAVLALVFSIVLVNVIGRYVFGTSFAWVEEAARHLMVFGAFCGAGLALREGRLVAIELLQDLTPAGVSRSLRWLGVLVMLVFMGSMAWLGVQFVEFGWSKETMSTDMSRGIPYLAIPIGCALFVVHLLLFARRYVDKAFEYDDSLDLAKPDEDIR